MSGSPSILLVEDDEDDYVLACEKLRVGFGNDVRLDWVSTWDEGLAAISDASHDVYLVDFRLGARTGLELVRAASEKGSSKPIILLTGEDSPDIDREAMEAGAVDYLVKSQVTADQLARSIRYGISQKNTEGALRQYEERFRSVVNHSPTKIHIKDAAGRYILINEEAARLFNVTEEAALGKTTHEIFPNTLADEFQKHDQAVLNTGKTVVQEEIWLQDGDEHIYLTTKFPIEDSFGKIVAVGAIGTDITERKRTEKALQESEERFQGFAEIGSDWMWEMDADLRFSYFSDPIHKITGVPREHYLGKTRAEVSQGSAGGDEWEQHSADMEAHRPFHDFFYTTADSNGETRHLSISGTPVFDSSGIFTGYRGIGSDITERKRAEEALRESESNLVKAQQLAKIGNWRWSIERDELSYCSEEYVRIHGVEPEEIRDLMKHQMERVIHPEDRERVTEVFRKVDEEGLDYEIDYRIICPNGDERHVLEIGETVSDATGQQIEHMGTLQDITERKRAEEALVAGEQSLQERIADLEEAQRKLEMQGESLARLADALLIARDEARAADRAKSEFLAAMSHELRTPLNAVLGFSEIIKNEVLGPNGNTKYREYADDIHDSGKHLLGLINDILDLSKIESGSEELHEDRIDIPELIQSVLKLVGQRAEQVAIKVQLEFSNQLPALRADERKLKQILVNLLSNAIKFSDSGSEVALWAWCRPDSGYVFQIIDTGIGIAPEDIPKAFSRFGQVEGDLNRQYQGTGLGLPLTKALIELHGGTLDLQSHVGVGTIITVRFPAERIVEPQRSTESITTTTKVAG